MLTADSVLTALRDAPGLPPWRDVLFIPSAIAVLPERVRIPVNRLVPLSEALPELTAAASGGLRLLPLAIKQNNLIVAWEPAAGRPLPPLDGEGLRVDTTRFVRRGD
jgi:hypothetical protein